MKTELELLQNSAISPIEWALMPSSLRAIYLSALQRIADRAAEESEVALLIAEYTANAQYLQDFAEYEAEAYFAEQQAYADAALGYIASESEKHSDEPITELVPCRALQEGDKFYYRTSKTTYEVLAVQRKPELDIWVCSSTGKEWYLKTPTWLDWTVIRIIDRQSDYFNDYEYRNSTQSDFQNL